MVDGTAVFARGEEARNGAVKWNLSCALLVTALTACNKAGTPREEASTPWDVFQLAGTEMRDVEAEHAYRRAASLACGCTEREISTNPTTLSFCSVCSFTPRA